MKISIEIDEAIHSVESNSKNSKDLYHIVLHIKGLLMGMGYCEEKIDGSFKGAIGIHLVQNSEQVKLNKNENNNY